MSRQGGLSSTSTGAMPERHSSRALAVQWRLGERSALQGLRQCIVPLLALLISAGPGAGAIAAEITLLPSPASAQSHLSRLTSDAEGRLWMSWVSSSESSDESSDESRTSLHYAHYASRQPTDKDLASKQPADRQPADKQPADKQPADKEWSAPRQIASGNDWFVNWADFPFLSVHDQGMVAHWLRKRDVGTYDYDIVASFYDAAADQWGTPITIHQDGVSAEHGFVSMQPLPQGRTFITWLDGRNTAPPPEPQPPDAHVTNLATNSEMHSEMHSEKPLGMTLRGGIFDRQGQTLQEWELDDLTCDCCQTSVAMAAAGPVVVYRDRTENEIRDIYITRLVDEQWSAPVAVHADNWQVAGCPVNGPAVVAHDLNVAVAWFTANDDQPRVKLAISVDAGASFTPPILVDEGQTNGRVSLALLPSGDMAISWLVTDGAGADIKVARYSPQGKLRDSATVATTQSSRRSGFPVLASVGDDLYITWTDLADGMQVKVAQIDF